MNTIYTCPMHPQIVKNEPGQCPICYMDLVVKKDGGHAQKSKLATYSPILIVVSIIFITSFAITLVQPVFLWQNLVQYFMIGFFLVFAMFKLMDLKGFAAGYETYDLLAKRWPIYGFIYPFVEVAFGLSMILLPTSQLLLLVEFIVMAFSGLGVWLKLQRKEKFTCACLGTFFKLPLTGVTLVEDFGMALLAALMLFAM